MKMKRTRSLRSAQGIVLVVGLVVLLSLYGVYRWGLMAPAKDGAPVSFVVKSGERVPRIADNLKAAGLIRDRNAFITYVNLHGLRGRIQAGNYSLAPTMSGSRIAETLAHGRTASNRVVVPEGYTLAKIKTLAGQHGIAAADFDAALAAQVNHPALSSKPAGVSLEGYLFPDSYHIDGTTSATVLVKTMLDTFGERVGQDYISAFKAQNLSLHEGVTLASIVEREVNIAADRPVVAGIFLNRLRQGMRLDSDVTVHYVTDQRGLPFDLNVNSPYNTRKFAGLPPGPICSPGLSALDAVAKPARTDYLYFLSGTDGKTYYAKTYEEHQRNIARYLN